MKNVLVTGTSSGIGRAIALRYAREGYQVFAGVRRIADAPEHVNIHPILLDMVSEVSIRSAVNEIRERTGGLLHALVNNAGTNLNGTLEYTNLNLARELFELNLWGPIRLTQECLQLLRAASNAEWSGKVISVGSIGSVAAVPWEAHYHGSKFGLLGAMESLHHELHSQGLRVSVVCPGGVRTEFQTRTDESMNRALSDLPATSPERYRKGMLKFHGIIQSSKKFGSSPERVAKTVLQVTSKPNPKFKILVGMDAHLIYILKTYMPEKAFFALYRKIFT